MGRSIGPRTPDLVGLNKPVRANDRSTVSRSQILRTDGRAANKVPSSPLRLNEAMDIVPGLLSRTTFFLAKAFTPILPIGSEEGRRLRWPQFPHEECGCPK